jgi:L-threonylcarbamoyladenylate synthase
MERILLSEVGVAAAAETAAAILSAGGVVLFPTDTLYGLGTDALSDAAVAKIYAIKGRNEGKPIHAIVESLAMAERFAHVDANARMLAQKLPQGKVTFILKKKDIDAGIAKGLATFGFRIPDSELCIAMAKAFGGPITATSANRSGAAPLMSVDAILAQLGEGASDIDLVIDAGELPKSEPSTVVDLSMDTTQDEGPVILREAAVSAADVWDALRAA